MESAKKLIAVALVAALTYEAAAWKAPAGSKIGVGSFPGVIFQRDALAPHLVTGRREPFDAPAVNIARQLSAADRRHPPFFRRTAAIILSAVALFSSLTFGQPITDGAADQYRRHPLPFPVRLGDPPPAQVQALVKVIDQKVREYQEKNFRTNARGEFSVIVYLKGMEPIKAVEQQLLNWVNELQSALYPMITADLKNRRLIDEAGIQAEWQRMFGPNVGLRGYLYVFNDFIPAYFARAGIHFIHSVDRLGTIPVAETDIRTVLRREDKTVELAVWPGDSIPVQVYVLGPSLTRTNFDYMPAIMGRPAPYVTRPYTNQVFVNQTEVDALLDLSVENLYSKFRLSGSSANESAFHRAVAALENRAISRVSGKAAATLSKEELRSVLSRVITRLSLNHEYVHVHDGLHDTVPSETPDFIDLIETRGQAGSIVSDPDKDLAAANVLNQSYEAYQRGTAKPGNESAFVYLRNRLSFQLWKNVELQRALKVTLPAYEGPAEQLADLPANIQSALWQALSSITEDAHWATLFQAIWDEIQTFDVATNPFLAGKDRQPNPSAYAPTPSRAPHYVFWRDWKVVGAVGLASAIAALIVYLLCRSGNGGGPGNVGPPASAPPPPKPKPLRSGKRSRHKQRRDRRAA